MRYIYFTLALFLFFSFSSSASAQVLVEQSVDSSSSYSTFGNGMWQLVEGVDGTVSQVQLYVSSSDYSASQVVFYEYAGGDCDAAWTDYTDGGGFSFTDQSDDYFPTTLITGSKQLITYESNTPYEMQTGRCYFVVMQVYGAGGSSTDTIYGSSDVGDYITEGVFVQNSSSRGEPLRHTWFKILGEFGDIEYGVSPTFPDGQTNVSYLTFFTGTYTFSSAETPNKLVFHISNDTDMETFDVVKNIVTDIDDVFGTSGGLTCENCPEENVTEQYGFQIALEAEKEYSYTVELMRNDTSYYESSEFGFETGDFGAIDDPTAYLNNGLTCDNCSSLEGTPSLMQNFFPFNIIWQLKTAMTNGLSGAGTASLGDVTADFLGGEVTVFSMSSIESTVNGSGESTATSDLIRGIISAGLYLGFAWMVYSSASKVIHSMTA